MAGTTGNAQDGIDAAGVAVPAGGEGIRGWLSGSYKTLSDIYTRLGGTLTVAMSSSSPLDISDRSARLLGHVTVDNTIAVGSDVTDRAARLLGHVTVDNASVAVTGTFWPATQPVSGSVSVANFPATQPVSGSVAVTNLPATQAVSGTVAVSNFPATQPVSGSVTVSNLPATQPVSGSVSVTNLPATQAVSGTVAVSNFPATQPVSVATPTRTPIVLSVTAAASIVTETAFTLNIWKAGVVSSGASYTVTTGKTFRLQAVQFGCRFTTPSTTVTFATARFNIRSGAVVTSPLVYGDSKLAAANAPTPNSDLAIPDGLEFPAGTVLSVWHADSAATLLLDVLLVGYEY